tara:strand:+ start:1553 stop:2323 length:771 start_codon:yes stop_codon:yes gene_type:complete
VETRPGRFERADTGTIFLDEVATLSLSAQGKLLRVLQEQELERVGGKKLHHIDVRVIAATNEDLRTAVDKGAFREDLYFRLNVFPTHIPPLRERSADIPLLMNHFLNKFRSRYEKDITGFTSRAIDGFIQYHWPGNIRELENLVERGVILAPDGGAIDLSHLFTFGETVQSPILGIGKDGMLDTSTSTSDDRHHHSADSAENMIDRLLHDNISLEKLEHDLLTKAVEKADGNLSAAARHLGITRPQLAYRLKKISP